MSPTSRRLAPTLLLALLPVLVGCGGSSGPSTVATQPPAAVGSGAANDQPTAVASGVASDSAQQAISLTVSKGKVTGDTGPLAVRLGTRIRITVLSDVADELHVHLYDLKQELAGDTAGSIEFVADRPGSVDVELEHAKLHLTRLQVR